MLNHKPLCLTIILLVVVGGLNWGLVGAGNFFGKDLNVVHLLFKSWPAVEWAIYLLVGLAAIFFLIVAIKHGKQCPCHKMNGRM